MMIAKSFENKREAI
jgi:hypothetical protein